MAVGRGERMPQLPLVGAGNESGPMDGLDSGLMDGERDPGQRRCDKAIQGASVQLWQGIKPCRAWPLALPHRDWGAGVAVAIVSAGQAHHR